MEGSIHMHVKDVPEMNGTRVSMEVDVHQIDIEGKIALFKGLWQALDCDSLETIAIMHELVGMATGHVPKGKRFYKAKDGTEFDADFLDMLRGNKFP